MMNIIRHALLETFGHIRTLFAGAVAGLLALGALALWKGSDSAMDEVAYYITGLIGAVGGVLLLFVWHLVRAPYRLLKARSELSDQKIIYLTAQLETLGAKAHAVANLAFDVNERSVIPTTGGATLLRPMLTPPENGLEGAEVFVSDAFKLEGGEWKSLKAAGDLPLWWAHNGGSHSKADLYEPTNFALILLSEKDRRIYTSAKFNSWRGALDGEPSSFKFTLKLTANGMKPAFATAEFVWLGSDNYRLDVSGPFTMLPK